MFNNTVKTTKLAKKWESIKTKQNIARVHYEICMILTALVRFHNQVFLYNIKVHYRQVVVEAGRH
jgi:hypothetical protein